MFNPNLKIKLNNDLDKEQYKQHVYKKKISGKIMMQRLLIKAELN